MSLKSRICRRTRKKPATAKSMSRTKAKRRPGSDASPFDVDSASTNSTEAPFAGCRTSSHPPVHLEALASAHRVVRVDAGPILLGAAVGLVVGYVGRWAQIRLLEDPRERRKQREATMRTAAEDPTRTS